MLGAILFPSFTVAFGVLMIVFRKRIAEDQKRGALRTFGKLGPYIAKGMTTDQIIVGAIAAFVLAAAYLIGFFMIWGTR